MRPNRLVGGDRRCTLVSASCTTSWFDWIHGELWLCEDGLFRRSLGLLTTIGHGVGPTVDPANRPGRTFRMTEILEIVARGRRNRWIPWADIRHATLKFGMADNSLHLDLTGDRREKFLWLAVDRGYEFLEKELPARLPGRFTASEKSVG